MKRIASLCRMIHLSPAALTAIAAIAIMITVLMVPPVIGMADNGDFFRTINGQGIYKLDRYENDQYFQYSSSKFGLYEYYNDWEKSLFSSQNLYIQAALFLNHICSADPSVFDIRFLSVFLILQLAAGIYVLMKYMTYERSRAQSLLLGLLCLLVFTDTAYTAYFNSFYGEGIVYASTLLMLSSALLMTQKRYPPMLLLFSIVVNGILLIFTKQQNATEGLPLFLLCLFIAFFFGIEKRVFKAAAVSAAVLLGTCGIIMYIIIPQDFVRINQYHAMTRGVMTTGENPEETLGKFGIDSQYSVLDGSIYYEKYPAVDAESELLEQSFYERYNFVSLSVYYLTHPGELVSMLNRAANNGYMIRPAVLGNYERGAGREPGEQTSFFTAYSSLKQKYVPNTVGFAAIWILVTCGITFRDRKKFLILLCAMMMGLIQVGTSIVGAGDADLAKHIFLYNVTFDIVTFVVFFPAVSGMLLQFFRGLWKMVRRRRRIPAALFLFLTCFFAVCGAAEASEQPTAAIIGKKGTDTQVEQKMAEACGMQVMVLEEYGYEAEALNQADYIITTSQSVAEEAEKADKTVICLGSDFTQVPGYSLGRQKNKAVEFCYEGYHGEPVFEQNFYTLQGVETQEFGTVLFGDGSSAAFAVRAEDGNYYAPCYDSTNQAAAVLLGALLQKAAGHREEGKTYFVLDEVYAFSDLEKLCGWAERLHDAGIPFLVRIMPLYDNLDYPAFLRFAQVLRYLQNKGGTVILHDALVKPEQIEAEPLSDKLGRFLQVLEEEDIYYREMDCVPYFFSVEELLQITSDQKAFGQLPFPMMTGVTPELTEEEFEACVNQLNEKWLSFSDLHSEYEYTSFLYKEKEIPEDFTYREQTKAVFEGFFDISDKILQVVVGASVIILIIFLLIGRRWYRRKFFK